MEIQPRKSYPTRILELNRATVRRNGVNILDRLSLTIDMNEHTAIIGPNGSGKSTLIHLLTRTLYPLAPKDGSHPVRLFGKHLWNIEELRSRLGIVTADLQRQFLNNTRGGQITGREVVISGFFSSLRLFPHQTVTEPMHAKALEALERMGAAHLEGRLLNVMSAGEARRVLIARALVTSPEVLVLDEPTTALDFVARRKFMEQIRQIAQAGTTLILVTHHIEEVIPEIGRVVLLKRGCAARDGAKKEVLTSECLSDVFEGPVAVHRRNGLYSVDPDG